MEWFGAIAASIAAAVLICSGFLKLGGHQEFAASIRALGLPAPLYQTGLFAKTFPLVEILMGTLILILPGGWYLLPMVAAAALYAAFLGVVVRALRVSVGPAPSCNCFGGLGEDRISSKTVVRNGMLTAVALLGLVGGVSPAQQIADQWGMQWYPAWWFVSLAVAGVLVWYRNNREKKAQMEQLDSLTVTNQAGTTISVREFSVDGPTYLVFFSSTCSTCIWLAGRFRWWPTALAEGYDMQIIMIGGDAEEFSEIPEFAPLVEHAWFDESKKFAKAVGMRGTPGVVLVDAKKPLGHGWVSGTKEMEKYVVRDGFYAEQGLPEPS